jgi:hypothetical protein
MENWDEQFEPQRGDKWKSLAGREVLVTDRKGAVTFFTWSDTGAGVHHLTTRYFARTFKFIAPSPTQPDYPPDIEAAEREP